MQKRETGVRCEMKSNRRDMDWLARSTAATLTRTEVAEILYVDERTISRAIADGQLPGIYVGRRLLIPRLPFLAVLGGVSENGAPGGKSPPGSGEAPRTTRGATADQSTATEQHAQRNGRAGGVS